MKTDIERLSELVNCLCVLNAGWSTPDQNTVHRESCDIVVRHARAYQKERIEEMQSESGYHPNNLKLVRNPEAVKALAKMALQLGVTIHVQGLPFGKPPGETD